MTPVALAPTPRDTVSATRTLSGEHARLMRDLTRRAAPVLALLDARIWPHAELGTLTGFLRSAVLRQVSDEEVYLFPHDSSAPPFAELTSDHVRLHTLTTGLEQLHAQPGRPHELRALVEELLDTLRRHLAAERDVLAALPAAGDGVPAAAQLAATEQEWLPDNAPVLILLDTLPADRARDTAVERLLRLRTGQSAELHTRDSRLRDGIGAWLHDFDPARFGLERATAGADHLLIVTCRGNAPSGIGYPG